MDLDDVLRHNRLASTIVLFLVLFGAIQHFKPSWTHAPDGSLRDFGVVYKNQTVVPMWLVSIFLGILCYVGVMYYLDR